MLTGSDDWDTNRYQLPLQVIGRISVDPFVENGLDRFTPTRVILV